MAQAQNFYEARAKSKVRANVVTNYHAVKKEDGNFGKLNIQNSTGQPTLRPKDLQATEGSNESGYMVDYYTNFYVSSYSNNDFSVSLPNSPIALTNSSENKTLFVSNWKSNLLNSDHSEILDDGFKKVFIRATVEVEPNSIKPEGLYTGFYIITFDFN